MIDASKAAESLTAEFWRSSAEARFVLPRCTDCRAWAWPPTRRCPACAGSMSWSAATGCGSVYAVTVVHRAPRSVPTPYVLALVQLSEGPRMLAPVVGEGALTAAIDDQVVVTFPAVQGDDVVRPAFTLEHAGETGGA